MSNRFVIPLMSFIAILGCAENDVLLPGVSPQFHHVTGCSGDCEGELLGFVYDGQSRIGSSDTGYWVMLRPDDRTRRRLRDHVAVAFGDTVVLTYDSIMWVKPEGHTGSGTQPMFDWFDVSQGCPRDRGEIHYRDPSGPMQSTLHERHCITAGTYELTLWRGNPESGSAHLLNSISVDYIQVKRGLQPTHSVTESSKYVVESSSRSLEDYHYVDLFVSFQLDPATTYTALPVLEVDEVGFSVGLEDATFTPRDTATAPSNAFFRFNTSHTTYTGPFHEGDEGPLLRLWFAADDDPTFATNYYGRYGQAGVMRTRSYWGRDERLYTVKLDYLTPVEVPTFEPRSRAASATVKVTAPIEPLFAQIEVERGTSVWRGTDQMFDGGTNGGEGSLYRWAYNGTSTNWSTASSHEFPGFTSGGTRYVTLWVKSPSGDSASAVQSFTVNSNRITLAGDTFVNVKWYTTYTSNVSGTWYTRHPTRSWEYEMFGAGSSFERLWPAGNYEVHVRQEGATPGYLSRGRMRIIVCTGCPDPDESEGPQSIASASRIGGLPLGTFGVGPFVVTDEELVSLYDLTGMSIPDDSPFSRTDWITSAGERAGEYPIPGGRLIWRSHRTSETTATITLRADGDALRMTTGLAWDPDLGDPSDDRSAYDETRRMLIAHDETEAIGLLLEIDGHAVPIRVQQYGARRLAPIGMNGIVNAISSPTTLLPEPDDVQFLVMADGVPAGREQRFKIVRAGSLEELLASVPEN